MLIHEVKSTTYRCILTHTFTENTWGTHRYFQIWHRMNFFRVILSEAIIYSAQFLLILHMSFDASFSEMRTYHAYIMAEISSVLDVNLFVFMLG